MKNQKKKKYSTILVIGVSLVIGFLGGYLVGFRYGIKLSRESFTPFPKQLLSQTSRVDLASEAVEIIKELNCICGCKMELLPCSCGEPRGSKEIKMFVRELVNQGLSKPEVIERAVEKYSKDILKEEGS